MITINCKVIMPSGVKKLPVQIFTRGGYMSPFCSLILWEGRRITPYEQRLKGWVIDYTLNDLFKITYQELVSKLVPEANAFLRLLR